MRSLPQPLVARSNITISLVTNVATVVSFFLSKGLLLHDLHDRELLRLARRSTRRVLQPPHQEGYSMGHVGKNFDVSRLSENHR